MKISNLESTVIVSRALGHPARLRAINMLHTGELCVCQIKEVLQLAQSTVSTHLRELKRAGLVTERKQGRWVLFALSTEAEALPWIDASLRGLEGDSQTEQDDNMVDEIRRLPVEDVCRLGLEAARALGSSKESAPNSEHDERRKTR